MMTVISSAKTMTEVSGVEAPAATTPRFIREAKEIALYMIQFPAEELSRMLKINPALAAGNCLRFQRFHSDDSPSLQALLAYTGVVFKNINPSDFSPGDFLFAQDSLRIASFCYGLLRPLDMIKPYRMEGGVRIPETGDDAIYAYWRDRQTDTLVDEVRQAGGVLINLAAMDIQPAFRWKKAAEETRIITPGFKVWKGNKARTIVIYAKMARGQMARYIIKNRINNPEELKNFSWEGFGYNEELSGRDDWVFLQG
ncbi:MAG: YaaA family protein [Tannerellaceae bacterium]|nr:YaaA family protein [Tannerellaceae bacterium]